MPSPNRRAAARRKAWGRGPTILRFEPLEGRLLLSTATTTTPPQSPDLIATAFDTLHNLNWGDSFHAVGTIENQGNAATTGPFNINVYASASQTIDTNAVYLGTISVTSPVQPGATVKFDQSMTLPVMPVPNLGTSPSFYIELKVDPGNPDNELNTADKQGLGQGFDTSVVTITPHQLPNLVGSGLQLSTNTATWGSVVQVASQISNKGPGDAPATRADIVATPAGQTPGGANDFTLGSINVPALPANQSITLQTTLNLPASPPSVLASASGFTLSLVQDVDFQANPIGPHTANQGAGLDSATLAITSASSTVTTSATLPQLSVSSIQTPTAPLAWGQTAQFGVTVQNLGTADAGAFRVQFALVDPSNPGPALILANTTISGLKAGLSQTLQQTIKLPPNIAGQTPPGTVQGEIQVTVDPEHLVDQSSRSGNTLASSAVTVNLVNFDGNGNVVVTSTSAATTTTTTTTTKSPAQIAAAARAAAARAAAEAKATAARAVAVAKVDAAKAARQAAITAQSASQSQTPTTPGTPQPAGTVHRTKTVKTHPAEPAVKAPHRRTISVKLKTTKTPLKVVGGSNQSTTA
jgi:hypothetical protein